MTNPPTSKPLGSNSTAARLAIEHAGPATPTPCECEAFKLAVANDNADDEYQPSIEYDGFREGWYMEYHLGPISFCPWCGKPVPQPETKAV